MITRNNGVSLFHTGIITFTRRLSVAPSCNGNSKLHETLGCTRSNKISISRRTQSSRACIFNAETARRRKEGKERLPRLLRCRRNSPRPPSSLHFSPRHPFNAPSLLSTPPWAPLPRRRVSSWIKDTVASRHDDA